MTDTVSLSPLRERIKDLNTKAYYLLVALSFIYRTSSESHLLKWALTLVAISAVFPVLDYVKSTHLLEIIRAMKVIFMTVALIFTLCWIWTA
jgi:predicted membrane protein